jgi:hypothetical protein
VTQLFGDLSQDTEFARQFAAVYRDIVDRGPRHALDAVRA